MDLNRINLFLLERRKTTNVEMTKAKRQLKIDKSRDTSLDLYDDLIKFLSVYLNSLPNDDLSPLKIVNRQKAEELILNMASVNPEAQAVLDKMHVDAAKFVAKYWTIKDMKVTIQDAVKMLLTGGVKKSMVAESANKRETPEEGGYEVVKLKGKELTLKDKDTGQVELWGYSPSFAGYAIVYKNKEYEFIREVK